MCPSSCYQSTNGLAQLRNFSKLRKEENLKEEHQKGSSKLVLSPATLKFFSQSLKIIVRATAITKTF